MTLSPFSLPPLKVTHRLAVGFALIVILLASAVAITLVEVGSIGATTQRIKTLRTPTANASSNLTNDINASLAALRGWMLTGNEKFKIERTVIWEDIDEVRANMNKLSKSWTNPKNVEAWSGFKATLEEFRQAQAKVEAIARSKDEQPATKMLTEEAAPRANVMSKKITEMIDLELANSSETGGDRVQFLGIMADVRGTLGLGLASIRAYLLTGEKKFVENFKKLWNKNERRFKDLEKASDLMSTQQKKAFKTFAEQRAKFIALPPKMFVIRGSKKWNMANYTLVTEAAPRAGKLLTALLGPKQKDGSRAGGMKNNQTNLLNKDADLVASDISQLSMILWVLLGIGVLSGGVIAFLTSRSIATPLVEMTASMRQLADGNLETDVPAQDRTDEVGEMSSAVQVFKENAIRNKALEAEQKEKRQVEEKRQAVISAAVSEFDASIGTIVNSVSSSAAELNSTALSMSSIAEETSSQATSVAAASEEASTNVQTVASATEEMSISIMEINSQITQASLASKEAVENVTNTAAQMEILAQASEKVGDVVSLISDIAEQTNLLALNATIEAARAGESGKGFAVVASEVKALANETAKATSSIGQYITEIQSATSDAVISIDDIGKVVKKIEETSTIIAAAMEEQGVMTQEVARNITEAATGTEVVSSNISGVTQASQETGEASSQVTSAAGELSEQAELMKSEVQNFLEKIQAA